MTRLILAFLLLLTAAPLAADPGDIDAAARGVVRVVIVGKDSEGVFPVSHGSGFAVSADRIVTNAHCRHRCGQGRQSARRHRPAGGRRRGVRADRGGQPAQRSGADCDRWALASAAAGACRRVAAGQRRGGRGGLSDERRQGAGALDRGHLHRAAASKEPRVPVGFPPQPPVRHRAPHCPYRARQFGRTAARRLRARARGQQLRRGGRQRRRRILLRGVSARAGALPAPERRDPARQRDTLPQHG